MKKNSRGVQSLRLNSFLTQWTSILLAKGGISNVCAVLWDVLCVFQHIAVHSMDSYLKPGGVFIDGLSWHIVKAILCLFLKREKKAIKKRKEINNSNKKH